MDNTQNIIRDFLKSPLDLRKFNEFYKLIYRHTLGCVSFLERKGYILPSETGDREQRLSDLTIDILGTLLRCDGSRPFHLVSEHFERYGMHDYDQVSSEDIRSCLSVLLNGHARQELHKLRKQDDPQIDNLKRRFKDILKGKEFASCSADSDRAEYVHLLKYAHDLRKDMRPSTGEFLQSVSEDAFRESNSRMTWCHDIFERINDETGYQNFAIKHELLSTVVSINCRELEFYADLMHKPGGPKAGMLRRELDRGMAATLEWAETDLLIKFRENGRISESESVRLMTALNAYLSDFCEHGQTDPIPRYFKESMPPEACDRYLDDYKYVFETLVNKSIDYLKEFVRKKATSLGYGDY
ncbi:MAG: hypothetical protein ABIK83_01350 [Candidatus Zixiibacteriota bacterium]